MTTCKHLYWLVTALCCWINVLSAQVPAAVAQQMQEKARAEISKRGLEESAVRDRLRQRGIDIDNITPQQALSLQADIEAVLQELEAEKKRATPPAGTQPLPPVPTETPAAGTPEIPSAPPAGNRSVEVQQKVRQGASLEEALSEEAEANAKKSLPPSPIYGQNLFREKSIAVFRATDEAKPPDSYVLGTGDEITISVFGPSQFDSKFTINREGYIAPSRMPKLFLKGLSLGQAKELLRSRFARFYRFAPEQFAVSLTTARTITVNLFGELNTYGSFTISAINTAFNALVAAGGPTDIGSLRNISVIRGGKTTRLDVYAFMTNPAVQYDFFLQDNDLIHVPIAERIVGISGGVRRNFRYELTGNEQLIQLIEFAGGLTANANRDVVLVRRYAGDRQVQIDVNLTELIAKKQDFPLQDGDEVVVRTVDNIIQNTVRVAGAVQFPGNYALTETPRLSDLLTKGLLKREARTDVAALLRKNRDQTSRLLTLSLDKALAAPGGADDPLLSPQDELTVYAQSRFVTPATISVRGAVRDTLTNYPFDPDSAITVEKAILLAGGLTEEANGSGYLIRTNPANRNEQDYLPVNVQAALRNPGGKDNVRLRPFDVLEVFTATRFSDASTVRVAGAVRAPGTFPYSPKLTLRDALMLSGGVRQEAALNKVDIFRVVMQENQPTRIAVATVEIDRNLYPAGGDNSAFQLLPFDEIVVRTNPGFELQRIVELRGEVVYPGRYALLRDNETLSEVIARAGGLTPEAYAAGASVFRAENNKGLIVTQLDKALQKPQSAEDHLLKQGDVVTVPKNENLVSIRTAHTNVANLYRNEQLAAAQINVAHAGKKRAGWYIRHFAGGFATTADSSKVYVQELNGRVRSTRDYGLFCIYPKVKRGGVVYVDAKPVRTESEKKGKDIDWDKKLTQFLAVASLVSTTLIGIATLQVLKDK